jgi:phosphosulfolactate phosphohydrolase-like enzyme
VNSSNVVNDSSTITLWSVTRPGCDVRCVIDAVRSGASLRGTARMLVDGTAAEIRAFADVDELMALNADWRLRVTAGRGGWQ